MKDDGRTHLVDCTRIIDLQIFPDEKYTGRVEPRQRTTRSFWNWITTGKYSKTQTVIDLDCKKIYSSCWKVVFEQSQGIVIHETFDTFPEADFRFQFLKKFMNEPVEVNK